MKREHINSLEPFLEWQQRPGAQLIHASQVSFQEKEGYHLVVGELGSVPNEEGDGYVGFSGVEICLSKTGLSKEQLTLSVSHYEPADLAFTVHLLVGELCFARDILSPVDGQNLLSGSFGQSRRGRYLRVDYKEQEHGAPDSLRVFLRRSQNQKTQTDPIKYQFRLST